LIEGAESQIRAQPLIIHRIEFEKAIQSAQLMEFMEPKDYLLSIAQQEYKGCFLLMLMLRADLE